MAAINQPTNILESDGDILIVLKTPDAPFAALGVYTLDAGVRSPVPGKDPLDKEEVSYLVSSEALS